MITCIIADDEIGCLERMETILQSFPEIKILAKEYIPELAVQAIIRLRPDIVFIDVEMPRMSGFEVVHLVRECNCHPEFIFTTGFNHYAIKAIKETVFDYLLKPIDIDDLKEAIEKYKNRISGGTVFRNESLTINPVVLSDREKEVLKLIMQGKTSKQISEELFISKTTVDTHRANILEKTGAKNSSELISLALEKRWV